MLIIRWFENLFMGSDTRFCVATVFVWLGVIHPLSAQNWSINQDRGCSDFMTIRVWPLVAERSVEAASLQVFPGDTVPDELPPMLGIYRQKGDTLLFWPRFPYQSEQNYVLYLPQSKTSFPFSFPLALGERLDSGVPLKVYPSADTLPANQLKFYLAFREAMALNSPYQYIWLEDQSGKRLENVFLEIEPALWDPSHQRLTLWFEPGRIKRGLIPNLTQGPPLEAANQYQLVINLMGLHNPRSTDTLLWRHSFWVKAADRQQPDMQTWTYDYPQSGTRDTFSVYFPESMDFALLESAIAIIDAQSQPLEGQILLGEQERSWHFVADQAWPEGAYILKVSSLLEDLAANNFKRLFDTASSSNSTRQTEAKWIDHRFIIQK